MLRKTEQISLAKIQQYYTDNGIMPTLKELTVMMGNKSKTSGYNFSKKLIKLGYVKKVGSRLAPDNLFKD